MSRKKPRKERRLQAVRRLEDVVIRVENPCPVAWGTMQGDRLVRHCPVCDLTVYDFTGMTPEEIVAIVNQHEGRLCAQFYARADGTMTTTSCAEIEDQRYLQRGGLVISTAGDRLEENGNLEAAE